VSQAIPLLLAQPLAFAPASSGQVLAPSSTISAGAWSPDGAATLHEATSAEDAAFAFATADAAVCVLALDDPAPALSTITSATLRLRVRRT